uniref:F-box/WD repeat-containing protein 9-like isoform X1 n=1 Tax=Styela clava TaxID=7725 RepID=UPI001939FB9D|nr:F-box/WD repeat-containing protein 9-like isoform X1 [Styela clava]
METPDDAEPCDCKQTSIAAVVVGEMMDFSSSQEIDQKPHLLKLPQEVLLHIFSYIEADYLLNTVSDVCQFLKNLLSNEKYWRIRLFQRFPQPFPIVQGDDLSWKEACKERELCEKTWKGLDMNNNMITLSETSGFATDAVHLMKNRSLCICGSRDRSITVWKLNPEPGSNIGAKPNELHYKNLMQHNGWVWSITSQGNQFCSTSFDSTVKFWDVDTLNMIQSVNARTAILCSSYIDDNTLIAGCYNKKTIVVDTRSEVVVYQHSMIHHRKRQFES